MSRKGWRGDGDQHRRLEWETKKGGVRGREDGKMVKADGEEKID
jgi:hypothetical protein